MSEYHNNLASGLSEQQNSVPKFSNFLYTVQSQMLCCNSSRFKFYKNDAEKRDLIWRNQKIEMEIEQDKITMKKTLKILLLGFLMD